MPSNSDSLSSVHSSSVKNQTKEKFDLLLKSVTLKKMNFLKEMESTSTSSENLLNEFKTDDSALKKMYEQDSEHYILNKFLDHQSKQNHINEISLVEDTINVQNENTTKVKVPIPKPRKKKNVSPTASGGTFEVTSPKVIQKVNKDGSPSSTKTYNVEAVGDILVHESPSKPKIVIKSMNLRNDESEILSDKESDASKEESDDNEKREKDTENRKDSIEHINKTIRNKKCLKADNDVNSKETYNYEKIIEIIVHKTDRLQLSSLVVHPVVKIHIVDIRNGKYFPKSDKTRSVVFFYENKDTEYISPVMTHIYNLQEKRILFPSWEEHILLNEDIEYFKNESDHIMLFFEVVDFLSVTMYHQLNQKNNTNGWHNIAFAFLKLSGQNGVLNIGKKVRLQLYHTFQSKKTDSQICNAWTWWKKKKLKKYPSTLYVTIKGIVSPTQIVKSFRSKTPIQRETSSNAKLCDDTLRNTLPNSEDTATSSKETNCNELKEENTRWTRIPNEICKLPNNYLSKLDSYDQGCFVMKFSYNGLYLACAVENDNLFCIVIYSILSLREVHKFPSHQALIYDIKWSNDDIFLLAASADNTVSVFSLSSCSSFQILPHPAFVYSCDMSQDKIIASGCYDGTLRIWKDEKTGTKPEFQLFQELEAHSGFITSLCFSNKSNIFSADSTGVIIEWQKEIEDWVLKRHINLLDLKETIINQIVLFPNEKKLLVHSRDSTMRIIDLKSGCILQWLRGSVNKRFQIFSCISPCGTYIFSGSENGFVHVWNSKNGLQIATYTPFSSDSLVSTIHCVDFHPFDNIMAISHYGKNVPVLLYCHDPTVQQPTVNVKLHEEYNEQNKLKDFLHEPKLKKIVKRNYDLKESDEKPNFKTILQKMDVVIGSQKK